MTEVEADPGLRTDEEAFDVLRSLDRAAKPRLHGKPQLVARAHVLNGSDRMEQMRPLGVGQHDAVLRAARTLWDRREDESFSPDGREPVRVAVDVGQLGPADVVVVKNRVNLPGYDVQAMTPEERLGLVASIGKETAWPRRDGALAHGGCLREHPLGVELVAPIGDVADSPAHRRQGQAVSDAS
jgi:hypothetical protein